MSVLAHSPFSSGKRRIFEDDDTTPDKHLKRARCLGGSSPSGRCVPAPPGTAPAFDQHQGGVHPSTFSALCALFPQMDEQTVSNVLAECGNDIDAAIRRLTDLKLGGASVTVTATSAQAAAGKDQGPGPAQAAAAAAHQQLKQQHQQHQHHQQQHKAEQAAAVPEPAAAGGPQTAEQWTDALVQEMAAARDLQDAKQRGAKMLQAFESFVTARASKSSGGSDGGSDGGGAPQQQQQRLEEVLRENVILKRAVAIQNARMQEAVAMRDAEIAKLGGALAAEQEARKALERSNYSLSVHLQMATGAGGGSMTPPGHRPPDVY